MDRGITDEASAPEQPRQLPLSARMNEVLAELSSAAAPAHAPRLVGEILAAERRGQSYLAFVPLFGPWLVSRSEVHTPAEKRTLWLVALGMTALALALIATVLPSPRDEAAAVHRRADASFHELAAFAEKYHVKHHAFPDAATWKHFAYQADPRFFDPWGRPYRYEVSDDRILLSTFGRDGVEGGTGEDADLSFEFSARSTE